MWSRVKAGRILDTEKPGSPVVARRVAPSPGAGQDGSEKGRQSPAATQPLLNREGMLIRAPFPDALEPEESGVPRPPSPARRPLKRPRLSSTPPEVPGTRGKQGDSHASTTSRHQQDNEPSPWLADLLETWKNPVFPPAQPQIPKTHDDALPRTHHHLPSTPTTSLQSRISRPALHHAVVISQVDRKFILARLPRPNALLVLIDQHAASERVKLEELMQAYFSSSGVAVSEPLAEPLRFELPPREADLLVRYRAHFGRWGIGYSPTPTAAGEGVTVFALPPGILERCRLEPRLLVGLLRSEAWRLEEGGVGAGGGEGEACAAGGEDWVRRFHGCPAGILDMLNSRACRSEYTPLAAVIP